MKTMVTTTARKTITYKTAMSGTKTPTLGKKNGHDETEEEEKEESDDKAPLTDARDNGKEVDGRRWQPNRRETPQMVTPMTSNGQINTDARCDSVHSCNGLQLHRLSTAITVYRTFA